MNHEDTLDVVVLRHAASQYWVAKKHTETEKIILKRYDKSTSHISTDFRLKKSMISHHVSYCDVFDGFIDREPCLDAISIELFEDVLHVE